MLEIETHGFEQYKALVGLAGQAFSNADLQLVIRGMMRPTPLPDGSGPVMEERLTMAGSIAEQFRTGGRSAYHANQWTGYGKEPVYEYIKRKRGGGSKVGTWDNSKTPLSRSLTDKRDPDHVEFVDDLGGMFGSHRGYAGTFSVGGPITPFDKVAQPARTIQPITDPNAQFAREVARAANRTLLARLGMVHGGDDVPLPRVSP